LDAHRKEGEWFAVPASIAIGATIEAANRLGEPILQVPPDSVPQIISQASSATRGRSDAWKMLVYPLLVGLFVALVAALS
jgi:hypothetical protein